jgi:hypothetical protein
MKHLNYFNSLNDYKNGITALPCVSYVKETDSVYFDEPHAVDRIYNAPLMNMCVANGWAQESEDYLTFEEAKQVASITLADLVTYEVVSAWEFKYFINVASVSYTGLTSGNNPLKYLYFPKIANGFFQKKAMYQAFPNLIKLHVSSDITDENTPVLAKSREGYDNSLIYIGPTTKVSIYMSTLYYYKTAIIDGTARAPLGSGNFNISDMTIYVKDDQVDAFKALDAYSPYSSNIKPLSEYNGDMDY